MFSEKVLPLKLREPCQNLAQAFLLKSVVLEVLHKNFRNIPKVKNRLTLVGSACTFNKYFQVAKQIHSHGTHPRFKTSREEVEILLVSFEIVGASLL